MKEDFFLIVDAGNTRIKFFIFSKNEELVSTLFLSFDEIKLNKKIIQQLEYHKAIFSSVRNIEESTYIFSLLRNCINVSEIKIPLKTDYKTIHTLGLDRLINANYAFHKASKSVLIIDIGTCIKFDFVDQNGVFLGGSISPGIHLRYKSLNDYTGNLPLLKETTKTELLGNSTNKCIHSGVINGIQGEINYFIDHYSKKINDLTIFVTGGDYLYFDYSSKNNIFAVENLTQLGLLYILKANA